MKKLWKRAGIVAMALLCGLSAGCSTNTGDEDIPEEDPTQYRMTTEEMREEDEYQERWLSIPNSRLVVNPFSFSDYTDDATVTQVEHSNRPTIPLNIGYLDPNSHKELGKVTTSSNLIMVLENQSAVRAEATEYSTSWQPDRLDFTAEYAEGLQAEGYDYFYDEKTVVRSVSAENGSLSVVGNLPGSPSYENNTLVIENSRYRIAIGFAEGTELKFYANGGEMFNKGREVERPRANGSWALDFEEGTASATLSVSYDTISVSRESTVSQARAPFEQNNVKRRMAERTKAWNQFFEKVPYVSFTDMPLLEEANALKGVTTEEVLHEYYLAWALIWASVLPENPENNYPYKQVTCGKPSMWDEGEPRASHSASWESFYGMQLLSYVDPDTAWSAYRGLMSLVDEDGMLGGESLPSENAHTAWILYQNKADKEALKEIYPALKRHLTWRFNNPRWILNSHDNPYEKDYDFCSNFMMDVDFAIKICEEIGETADVAYWEDLQSQMYENIKTWFYRDDRSAPYQCYYTNDGSLSSGAQAWVVKSLWMQDLEGEYLTRTVEYALNGFNINSAFAGLTAVKYDSYAYTAQGLIRNGQRERGTQLLEMGMRDVVLSRFIAETYYPEPNGIYPEGGVTARGVRPTLFGASIMIESVLQTNGLVRYWGGVSAINLYDRISTVTGITVDDMVYTLTIDGINGKATVVNNEGKRLVVSLPRGAYVRMDLANVA